MSSSQFVWYIELRGPEAVTQLRQVLEQIKDLDGFGGAELQTSPAQPQLALLASRWHTQPPTQKPLPVGAKAWAFVVVQSVAQTF